MTTKDFRASQIETSKIIGTGSITGTTVGIAIYSGSIANNRSGGTSDAAMFNKVGTDVFLFVSGNIDNTNNTRTNATLFGGDVVVSGTLYAERQVIEVDSVADGDFFVTGNMYVEPDSDSTKSVAFRAANGNDILIVDSTNKRVGIGVSDPDSTLEVFSTSTQLKLSNNTDDFATFAVGTNGDLTITTVDTAGGNAKFEVNADGAVDIDANAGLLSLDGSTGINIGVETDVPVDLNSSTLDIDASGAISIDGTAAIGITSTSSDTTVKSTGARVVLSGSSGSDSVLVQSDMEIVGSLHGASPLKINDDIALTGSARFKEQSAPGVGQNEAVLYAKDDSGITKLFMKQSDGTEVGPLGSGGSLDDAYDTPNGGGTRSAGAGGIITVDGQPIQLQSSGQALSVSGSSVFNEGGGSHDFRVESSNNQNMLIVKGSTDRVGIGTVSAPQATLHLKEAAPTFRIQRSNNGNNSTLEFAGSAGAVGNMVHLASSNDLVFSTHDGVDQEEILRLGGHQVSDVRQVILLSGSEVAASSMQPKQSTDINFFVSGAIGSRTTTRRGTSLFGGDLVSSGTISKVDETGNASVTLDGPGVILSPGSVVEFGDPGENIFGDGSNLYISSSNNILVEVHDQVKFHKTGEEFFQINHNSSNNVLLASNGTMNLSAENTGIVLEGNASTAKVTFHDYGEVRGMRNTLIGSTVAQLNLDTKSGEVGQVTFLTSSAAAGTPDPATNRDVNFFVSGSKRSKDSTTDRGTALFGGDVAISGSLYKSVTTYAFFQSATPGSDPTNEFHFEWATGGMTDADPENNNQNDLWMFFPKGGRILDITARGGGTDNSSSSNPYTQRLVLGLYLWSNDWINSSNNVAHGGYTPIGHVTSSIPQDDVVLQGGIYKHKAVSNMDYAYFRNNATGSFEIPAGSSISLTYKGIGGTGAAAWISKTMFYVTVERDL